MLLKHNATETINNLGVNVTSQWTGIPGWGASSGYVESSHFLIFSLIDTDVIKF